MWRVLVLVIFIISSSSYGLSIKETNDQRWIISHEDRVITQSVDEVINQLSLTEYSILDINLQDIPNLRGVNSHNSTHTQIHFSMSVKEMMLTYNETHTTIQYDGNKPFSFSGFSKVYFKGQCEAWKIIFPEFTEIDTIKVGRVNTDNSYLSLASTKKYFPDLFLQIDSITQELKMVGIENSLEFPITTLSSFDEKIFATTSNILVEQGGVHSILFLLPSDPIEGNPIAPEVPITDIPPVIDGTYYGSNILIDSPVACPLIVYADTITVSIPISCPGNLEMRFVSCDIHILSSGSLTTDTGPITFDCSFGPVQPTFSYTVYGPITTQGTFTIIDAIEVSFFNTMLTAQFAYFTILTPNLNTFSLYVTNSNFEIANDLTITSNGGTIDFTASTI